MACMKVSLSSNPHAMASSCDPFQAPHPANTTVCADSALLSYNVMGPRAGRQPPCRRSKPQANRAWWGSLRVLGKRTCACGIAGIAIGGDVFPGSTLSDHCLRYQNIPEIKMIVVLGELGGQVKPRPQERQAVRPANCQHCDACGRRLCMRRMYICATRPCVVIMRARPMSIHTLTRMFHLCSSVDDTTAASSRC